MNNLNLISIDLAKTVCQIYYISTKGPVNRTIKTKMLAQFFANFPRSTVVMETCGTSHHWGRKLQAMGHKVKLLPAQFVKPFVVGNKNDKNDAKAIWVAAHRDDIRGVSVKSVEQQEINFLHNIRQRTISERTKIINQTRALLREFGIKTKLSKYQLYHQIDEVCECADNELGFTARWSLQELKEEWVQKDQKIKRIEEQLKRWASTNPTVQRILKVPGIGLISATAILSSYGDLNQFKKGRNFSAWLGLVPAHSGSGGKNKVLGLSKRCDPYIKKLMIHGARSILALAVRGKGDYAQRWAEMENRIGFNKTCVAIANRNARAIWAMITRNEEYLVV